MLHKKPTPKIFNRILCASGTIIPSAEAGIRLRLTDYSLFVFNIYNF
jgi:hypothetical protein